MGPPETGQNKHDLLLGLQKGCSVHLFSNYLPPLSKLYKQELIKNRKDTRDPSPQLSLQEEGREHQLSVAPGKPCRSGRGILRFILNIYNNRQIKRRHGKTPAPRSALAVIFIKFSRFLLWLLLTNQHLEPHLPLWRKQTHPGDRKPYADRWLDPLAQWKL